MDVDFLETRGLRINRPESFLERYYPVRYCLGQALFERLDSGPNWMPELLLANMAELRSANRLVHGCDGSMLW